MTLQKKLAKIEQRLKVLEPNMPNFIGLNEIHSFKEPQIRVRLIDKVSIFHSERTPEEAINLLWDESIDSFYDINGSYPTQTLSIVILKIQREGPLNWLSLDGSIKT